MTAKQARETAARIGVWLLTAITSLYLLLCGIDFAWNNLIKDRRYPAWVAVFLSGHALLTALAAALAGWPLAGRRRLAWAALAAAGLALSVKPGLLAAGPGAAAPIAAAAVWVFYAAWELLLIAGKPPVDWRALSEPDDRLAPAGFAAGLLIGAAYASGRSPAAWLWSLVVHGAAGSGAGLFVEAASSLSARLGRRTQAAAVYGLLTAGAACVLYNLVLRPLSAPHGPAAALAWIVGAMAALALFRQSALAHASAPRRGMIDFAAAPAALIGLRPSSTLAAAAALAGILLWPRLTAAAIGGADWNFMIASMAALACWAAAATALHAWLGAIKGAPRRWWLLPACVLASCLAAMSVLGRLDAGLRFSRIDVRADAAALAKADPTLIALGRLAASASPVPDFYAFLQRSTNIPRTVPLPPRDIELSTLPPGRLARKPHVFILVIDSLRQDYVGVYNPAVRFTPAFDAFSKDALVFKNAFTAYGATGLSEPSIWSGARLVHKQYVLPFSPMNSLEKLVTSEDYYRAVTVDVILGQLLDAKTANARLDENTVGNYKLCGSLDELDRRLDGRPADKPVFAYTQPQDIHISVIQREGAKPLDRGSYEGFYAPYASRAARLDQCFGRFIGKLKERGLYDDSIIVLTADHGDSLGEDGRWGHAYTLFPEILRVPLIMRVPERLKQGKAWDLDAPAFLIDITPTLYALLGRPPDVHQAVFGRSLIGDDAAKLAAAVPKRALVASSYGPVYGLLTDSARRLYIADAINYQTYLFDLRADPRGRRNLSDAAAQAEFNPALIDAVQEVNAFYEFSP